MGDLFQPQLIVMLAGGTQVLAYLFINQIALRLLILLGSLFYIWYYTVAADTPLWEAIYLTTLIMLANLIGLAALFLRQSKHAVPIRHRDIYARFSEMPPGDFRALMRLANRRVVNVAEQITAEGAAPMHLTYLISGGVQVEKDGDRFTMPAGIFVGEVAYILRQPSAASIRVSEGSEVLQWDIHELRRKAAKSPRFGLALDAMISKDLALKVQAAVAPDSAQWRAREA